ncbi:MAG: AMP-binding protein [Rhodospirillales bacterium]
MQNLTRYLAFHARRRPDAEALIYGDARISWAELEARVLATAAGLAEQGIGPDSIVMLAMKNSAAYVELLYAVSHLGAVSLPVNFRLSAEEVAYIAGHAGAELLLVDAELKGLSSAVTLPVVTVTAAAQADSRRLFASAAPVVPAARRDGGDLFRLMYTSGTTDRPKGVTHSYDNFYWKNLDLSVNLGLGTEDRLCIVGPLYHVGGCDLPGMAVHMVGGCIVLLRDFTPEGVMETIQDESVTGIWLAPVMTNAILALTDVERYAVSSLKWCVAGGERTPESRIRRFVEVFPQARYVDAYGMTETVSGDALMEPGFEIEKIGSVGRPIQYVELEIRDQAGQALPVGVEGEICMRGPKVTGGYWNDPERSAAAFWPDGFLRSGDVGYLDAEGFLFLTDRMKDVIISGGENVSSSEVERVLYDLPQVLEAAVIAKPDDRWGEVPLALVVLRPDATLDFADLDAHCRRHLAGFKCPKDLHLLESLPRNPSGKVLKRVLRARLLED